MHLKTLTNAREAISTRIQTMNTLGKKEYQFVRSIMLSNFEMMSSFENLARDTNDLLRRVMLGQQGPNDQFLLEQLQLNLANAQAGAAKALLSHKNMEVCMTKGFSSPMILLPPAAGAT